MHLGAVHILRIGMYITYADIAALLTPSALLYAVCYKISDFSIDCWRFAMYITQADC